MLKFIGILLTGILTSFYFFPFFFKAFPAQNTKNMMGAVGAMLIVVHLGKIRKDLFNKEWLQLFVYAALVSLVCFISISLNNTPDYSYTTYLISMVIWVCSAYTVLTLMQRVHGEISLRTLVHYLMAVCLFQCVMALWIDNNMAVKAFVDSYIEQGQDFLNNTKVNRLYGIGANLDVAGTRFAAVLVMIAYLLMQKGNVSGGLRTYYAVSFLVISIIGNMIARTTSIGMGLAVMYLLFMSFRGNGNKKTWKYIFWIAVVAVPILVTLYHSNAETRKLFRFAFEGFFSLAEKGTWEVSSNDRLMELMVVFPDNLKTWLIGDGYFSNPRNTDPYFTGKITGGYYMGTDIGYLRFIFYFGVIGLMTFMLYFAKVTQACCKYYEEHKHLFLMFLAINFIVWFKVATDIFLVFALFLMLDVANRFYHNKTTNI